MPSKEHLPVYQENKSFSLKSLTISLNVFPLPPNGIILSKFSTHRFCLLLHLMSNTSTKKSIQSEKHRLGS